MKLLKAVCSSSLRVVGRLRKHATDQASGDLSMQFVGLARPLYTFHMYLQPRIKRSS